MSSDHIERQRSNVECAFCCDIMKKPVKILPCGHSFCENCLIGYATGEQTKQKR